MAAKQANLHQMAALGQHVDTGLHRLAGAHAVDDGPHGAACGLFHLGLVIVLLGAEDGIGTGLQGCCVFGFIGLDHHHTCAAHGLHQQDSREAQAARAKEDDFFVFQHLRVDLVDGAVRRQARAGVRRCALWRHVANIDQVTRAGHQHMVGIAAGLVHAHGFARQAQVLIATLADLALAAAVPREDHVFFAHFHALGVGAHGHHGASNLVAHGQRQLHAARCHRQLFSIAQVVLAMPDMQVGVADAGGIDAHQHLVASGRGGFALGAHQGFTKTGHFIADHCVSYRLYESCLACQRRNRRLGQQHFMVVRQSRAANYQTCAPVTCGITGNPASYRQTPAATTVAPCKTPLQ